MKKKSFSLKVNGQVHNVESREDEPLLWVLRDGLQLTGTKFGCGEGQCGACTVLIDDQPVYSCLYPVSVAADKEIETIEGQAQGDELSPVQQAFKEHTAFGCGYCTPGQIMRATALLRQNPSADREQIVEYMSANLCRCAAYPNILAAVESVTEKKA